MNLLVPAWFQPVVPAPILITVEHLEIIPITSIKFTAFSAQILLETACGSLSRVLT